MILNHYDYRKYILPFGFDVVSLVDVIEFLGILDGMTTNKKKFLLDFLNVIMHDKRRLNFQY